MAGVSSSQWTTSIPAFTTPSWWKRLENCLVGYAFSFAFSLWLCGSPKTGKFFKRWEWIPDLISCLLRNLYAGQEATVRSGHGAIGWFEIGKGVRQGCILSPCLFNFYEEYIMWNAGLDEAPAGIKVAGRNISNLRYADDTTLMAESEEELKSLLKKVKEDREKLA